MAWLEDAIAAGEVDTTEPADPYAPPATVADYSDWKLEEGERVA